MLTKEPLSPKSPTPKHYRIALSCIRVVVGISILIFVLIPIAIVSSLAHLEGKWKDTSMDLPVMMRNALGRKDSSPVIIAYAVSITGLPNGECTLVDRAAVLHQSIKRATKKSTKFQHYHIYAFVHPDAVECIPMLTQLGYRIQVRETPFNVSDIQNPDLKTAQKNGCCGEKEYLKLYSYLLFDYPVVVHLDLDTIVLKPMDDVFSVLTDPTFDATNFTAESTMWAKNASHLVPKNEEVNFFFTRDYNMISPPRKQVHQIGVQGGFLIVRPNQRDFDRMIRIILAGGEGYTIENGWGGSELGYGGYYGAGTIQGLASFYYGHYESLNRSVELNRCYYNNMADGPYANVHGVEICRTLEETCQDCRITPLKEVYTAHFTTCGKPDWCTLKEPGSNVKGQLCMDLFREWHRTRLSLEEEWMSKFPGYDPQLHVVNASESRKADLLSYMQGHCRREGQYIPMVFPSFAETNGTLIE